MVNTSGAAPLINPTITRRGDSDGGNSCNFYGLNAALPVMGGSTTTITSGSVHSAANGANGFTLLVNGIPQLIHTLSPIRVNPRG